MKPLNLTAIHSLCRGGTEGDGLKTIVFLAMILMPLDAHAGIYFTDNAAAADIWVTVTDNAAAADCWIYSGDLVQTPSSSDIWLIRTDNTAAADKWVIITDIPAAASDLTCLKGE